MRHYATVQVDVSDQVEEMARKVADERERTWETRTPEALARPAPGVEWTIVRARKAKSVRDLVHCLVSQIGDDVLRREVMARLAQLVGFRI